MCPSFEELNNPTNIPDDKRLPLVKWLTEMTKVCLTFTNHKLSSNSQKENAIYVQQQARTMPGALNDNNRCVYVLRTNESKGTREILPPRDFGPKSAL